MEKKTRVAVIGYGHLGRWHCQKVEAHSEAKLCYIVEQNEEARKRAKEAHPAAEVVSNIEEVINQIDSAIIVTPTSIHYQLLDYLIKNNKHVFCEKPVTSTFDEATKINQLSKDKKLVLQVGHSERFHQAWDFREKFSSFFNEPGTIKINRLAPFKGRATDVDWVQDLMIHDIDLMLFLFKEKPVKVKSSGYKIRTDKWDYVCSEFHYESGRRVIITVGRNHVDEVRELEITGKSGCLRFDLFRNKIIHAPSDKTASGEFVESFDYEKRDHLLLEHKHFYGSIMKGEQTVVNITDGMNAVFLVDKVLEGLSKNLEMNLK